MQNLDFFILMIFGMRYYKKKEIGYLVLGTGLSLFFFFLATTTDKSLVTLFFYCFFFLLWRNFVTGTIFCFFLLLSTIYLSITCMYISTTTLELELGNGASNQVVNVLNAYLHTLYLILSILNLKTHYLSIK